MQNSNGTRAQLQLRVVAPTSRYRRQRRKGNVLLFVALSLVMLLGFTALAVDYGRMVATKNHLQRTCDASALAGATDLPATDSTAQARAVAAAQLAANQNGVQNSETVIQFPSTRQVRVTATRQVNYLFAPVLGLKSGTVNATALAGRTVVADVPYVSPLAITVDDYNTHKDGRLFQPRLIDNNRQDFFNGTVAALDLNEDNSGKSGDNFEEDLKLGWYHKIYFNQQTTNVLNAALASETIKINNAMNYRFNEAKKAPWYDYGPGSPSGTQYTFPNYHENNPRILIIVVAEQNPANNNNPKLIPRFFAPIYVEQIIKRGGDDYMVVRILPGLTLNNDNPRIVLGDNNTPDTGLSVIRLLS